MKILERRIYRGPNLYAHFPVIRLRVDLEALEDWPTAKLPGPLPPATSSEPSRSLRPCLAATTATSSR